ncbi:MAG TPA: HAMP domain-containing sensor histidine kinase [Acidimicrobiales bacterium]|jgi:signal transduction histidine kinase|nr:HAMP domain-containing sensor histidine kinase [Acidimicrobiales bacterium]
MSESARDVRSGIRRVAVRATLAALVVYLAACAVADLVVANRLQASTDARLSVQLGAVIHSLPSAGPIKPIGTYAPVSAGDFDDAPIVVWWIGDHARVATPLDTNAPELPKGALAVSTAVDASIAGHPFRLEGAMLGEGRIVVGTSARSQRGAISTLLVIEAALSPIALIALFTAAWLIGRRATAPIELSRRQQLEFTADASHELRTPLSVIEAEVGLALSTERSSSGYREAIERIAGESARLRFIVEDLVWLSRFESLPQPPSQDTVDLTSIVTVCSDRFAPIAEQRGISITTSAGAVPVLVLAPADWLDRLASVLVDNACRYAGTGGSVSLSASETAGRARLTVDDSGPGIPVDQRNLIFERFHRATSVPGGAGLGLAIANAIVKSSGGTWEISTAPLGGARFTVTWPVTGHRHSARSHANHRTHRSL